MDNNEFIYLPLLMNHKEVVVLQYISSELLQIPIQLHKAFNRGTNVASLLCNHRFCLQMSRQKHVKVMLV